MPPRWNSAILRRHHRKRMTKDAGCFEDLLGIIGQTMTESQYEMRTDDAVTNAWGEYEGEGWDVSRREYSEARAYYVDNDLVVAVTDSFRNEYITCFHEHFDHPHGVIPGAGATEGQKQLRYIDRLKFDEQGGAIRNVKRIRGL
jgi:hypothetical protein